MERFKILPNKQLVRNIRAFWRLHMNDLEYCNKKFDHLQKKVIDHVIALCGRPTGL